MALLFMNDSKNCITKSIALYLDASPLPLAFMWASPTGKRCMYKTRWCCCRSHFGGVEPGLRRLRSEARRGAGRGARKVRGVVRLSPAVEQGDGSGTGCRPAEIPITEQPPRYCLPPPPHGIAAESGILYVSFFYMYVYMQLREQ